MIISHSGWIHEAKCLLTSKQTSLQSKVERELPVHKSEGFVEDCHVGNEYFMTGANEIEKEKLCKVVQSRFYYVSGYLERSESCSFSFFTTIGHQLL